MNLPPRRPTDRPTDRPRSLATDTTLRHTCVTNPESPVFPTSPTLAQSHVSPHHPHNQRAHTIPAHVPRYPAADYGFDPLGLSKVDFFPAGALDKSRAPELVLRDYRDAELRHGRLAMLAALAWPVQVCSPPVPCSRLRTRTRNLILSTRPFLHMHTHFKSGMRAHAQTTRACTCARTDLPRTPAHTLTV